MASRGEDHDDDKGFTLTYFRSPLRSRTHGFQRPHMRWMWRGAHRPVTPSAVLFDRCRTQTGRDDQRRRSAQLDSLRAGLNNLRRELGIDESPAAEEES